MAVENYQFEQVNHGKSSIERFHMLDNQRVPTAQHPLRAKYSGPRGNHGMCFFHLPFLRHVGIWPYQVGHNDLIDASLLMKSPCL